MPVDYSKWDALELSDDSDFEPHPNVDKRSFIRAKQHQIHEQRAVRKHQVGEMLPSMERIAPLSIPLHTHLSRAALLPLVYLHLALPFGEPACLTAQKRCLAEASS